MSDILLIDGNNLAMRLFLSRAVQSNPQEIKGNYDLWRYLMFTNMVGYASKETRKIVVAVDGAHGSWRKMAFKPYKAHRKAKRDASDFDWVDFFKAYNSLMSDIAASTPIKVINIDKVEGDDVVGVIALNEDKEKFIKIITADSDYKQLLCDNVKVYDPMKNEYMECEDVGAWLIEQILTGQQKDNIYNIMTPDDWGETKETLNKRKPGFGPVAAKKVMSGDVMQWITKNKLEKHFVRNRLLIDLRRIPQPIVDVVLTEYKKPTEYNPGSVDKFFEDYGWDSLSGKLETDDNRKAHEVLSRLS